MKSPLIAATCDGVGASYSLLDKSGWFEGLGQDLRRHERQRPSSAPRPSPSSLPRCMRLGNSEPQCNGANRYGIALQLVAINMRTHRW